VSVLWHGMRWLVPWHGTRDTVL